MFCTHEETPAPGRHYLLMTGILMILLCGWYVLASFQMMISLSRLPVYAELQPSHTAIWFRIIATVVICLYGVFIGIMGIRYRNDIYEGQWLMRLGILKIAAKVGVLLIGGTTGLIVLQEFGQFMAIFPILLNWAVPLLFIYGAMQNKKAIV